MLLFLAELVALVGGTVHSMVPGEPPRVADILIRDGSIEAVGEGLVFPPGTERFEVSGLHIVPGLIDGMVNFDSEHDALYVASGITTVYDVGGERVRLLLDRRPEARDRTPGPRLLTAGAVLDGDPPNSASAVVLRDKEAADGLVPILLQDGVDFLSIHLGLGAEPWQRALELAHAAGLGVWGPVPKALTLRETVDGGQDGIFYLDSLLPPGIQWRIVQPGALEPAIEILAAGSTGFVPLLHAAASRLRDSAGEEILLQLLSPQYEVWWRGELEARRQSLSEAALQLGTRIIAKERAALLRLHEAGVHLVPGSASPHPWLFPGQALHREFAEWEEAGIPPAAILEYATRRAAEAMGIEGTVGTLAPGMVADILVLEENPLESARALQYPSKVLVRGQMLERALLDDLIASIQVTQSKARKALNAPIDIAAPPLPTDFNGEAVASPNAATVLEGVVETYVLEQRVSAERFLVAREPDGRVHLAGRTKYPQTEGELDREMIVGVTLDEAGRMLSFRVAMKQGDKVIECFGLWQTTSFHLRRLVNGFPIVVASPGERPLAIDIGSIVVPFILGQRLPERPFAMLTFHEALDPELSRWEMIVDGNGDHHLRTHLGRMAWRFDERGVPILGQNLIGRVTTETRLVRGDEWGGAGLPFKANKVRLIAEKREAAEAEPAAVEAQADEAGEPGDVEPAGIGAEDSEDTEDGEGK